MRRHIQSKSFDCSFTRTIFSTNTRPLTQVSDVLQMFSVCWLQTETKYVVRDKRTGLIISYFLVVSSAGMKFNLLWDYGVSQSNIWVILDIEHTSCSLNNIFESFAHFIWWESITTERIGMAGKLFTIKTVAEPRVFRLSIEDTRVSEARWRRKF